jgi:hypothetical protein
MKVLKIGIEEVVLRDDLETEDLTCLLDLLRGVTDLNGRPKAVFVGHDFLLDPAPYDTPEEPQP